MTGYLALYIFLNLFCIAILLVCIFHSRVGLGIMTQQNYFVALLLVVAVFFASDTIWYAMNEGALPQVWSVSMVLKSCYFLSATLAGYTWFLYTVSLSESSFITNRKITFLLAIPVLVHVALCVINFQTPLLFAVDQTSFEYSRGPFFGLQYVIVYAYLGTASASAIRKAMQPESALDRMRYILIALFPVLPAISGVVQLFYWRFPFNCMAFTLSIIIVYLNELGRQISQEPLTQLANRKQFMRTLQQLMRDPDSIGRLRLFMIDVNRFKSINDTFGHIEGDQALIMVADAIRNAAKTLNRRALLARFGGDEFAIAACFDQARDVDAFIKTLHDEIEVCNANIKKDYRLSLSVGVAQLQGSHESMRSFINEADEALYREKSSVSR